jgi:hypothetical protein
MSEQYQWRQLGSIVNSVLLETRTKAIRTGAVKRPAARPFAQRIAQAPAHAETVLGVTAQAAPAPERGSADAPAQLELPFGIAASSQAAFGQPRAPRGARLM